MAGPRLNADVLAVVCEFLLDVSDVRSLTLTCSSVYPIAVRWLLSMRPVYLGSGPSIYRFHSFLRADAPARAPHVRAVHINLKSLDEPDVQGDDLRFLLDILGTCRRIDHITLAFGQASRHMADDSCIVHAITGLPSLCSLSIYNSESSTVTPALLLQISAPLRVLGVHCQNTFLSFWYPAALERFLPRVAGTLEKLEIAKFAVDHRVIHAGSHTPQLPIASLTRYPALRSLSVDSFEGLPLLEDLQQLFPALDGTLSLGSLDIRCGEETYDHIRAVNLRAQERSGDSSLLGVWTGLDRIVCSGPMLYVLGLRCPIRLVMIDFGGADKYGRYVAGTLRENPVPRLKLTLEHDLAALQEVVLSPKLAETLTHLTLCLLYWNDYQYPLLEGEDDAPAPLFRWEDVLDRLASAIRPLHRLTHLRVVIGVKLYVYDHGSPPFPLMDEYAHSFRESRFDFAGAATALARALPSLGYIFLTTGGCFTNWAEPVEGDQEEEDRRWRVYERWYVGHGWRVTTPEVERGDPGLVELHEDVAETIIRKEKLVLS